MVSPLVGFALGFVLMIAHLVDLPEAKPAADVVDLPPAADCLGRVHGTVARQQRRPEDDGHHRDEPGDLLRRVAGRGAFPRADLGHGGLRDRDGRWGRWSGGVRIIKTMGTKIIELKPVDGFAAETSAAVTILAASHLGLPVSTTHVLQRRDHGSRLEPAGLRGAVGGDGADHVGLGADDPDQRGGVMGVLPGASSRACGVRLIRPMDLGRRPGWAGPQQ